MLDKVVLARWLVGLPTEGRGVLVLIVVLLIWVRRPALVRRVCVSAGDFGVDVCRAASGSCQWLLGIGLVLLGRSIVVLVDLLPQRSLILLP